MTPGQCPKCGCFCSKIKGFGNDFHGLVKVTGVCKRHKAVDLSNQDFDYDDFWNEPIIAAIWLKPRDIK